MQGRIPNLYSLCDALLDSPHHLSGSYATSPSLSHWLSRESQHCTVESHCISILHHHTSFQEHLFLCNDVSIIAESPFLLILQTNLSQATTWSASLVRLHFLPDVKRAVVGAFSCQMASSTLQFLPTLRVLVVLFYFALTLFFYTRAPSGAHLLIPSGRLRSATTYPTVGAFGDMMIAMLGPSDVPFTLFVPSHAAFLNVSSTFRRIQENGEKLDITDTNSPTYAIMSHLLSFAAIPKPISSNHVPVGKEVVYESLSGFLLSLTRVPGRGLLVNNLTCAVTDLHRERFVIHIVNGVLMDFEFNQSIVEDAVPADEEEEDSKEEVDQEDVTEDPEHQSHV